MRRLEEEADASRRMWDDFERTRPLSDPQGPADEEREVTPAKPRTARLAAKD